MDIRFNKFLINRLFYFFKLRYKKYAYYITESLKAIVILIVHKPPHPVCNSDKKLIFFKIKVAVGELYFKLVINPDF